MAEPFAKIPLYEGWGKPLRIESTIDDLELVEGEVPREIAGTWYRAGPDRQYSPMSGSDVFIDGEGMAHMFRFENGNVSYRSRWVKNGRYLAQKMARRSLFGNYRNRYTDDPSVTGVNGGTANTNVIFSNGRLLVLKEDDLPFEVDPDTLAPVGYWNFDGCVKASSMSAHPKWYPQDGRLLTFSYQAKGDGSKDIVFYEFDDNGRVRDEIWFEMPHSNMVHDFAITPNFAIFPFMPMVTRDVEVRKRGGAYFEWRPDEFLIFAVVKRGGDASDIRWFRGPAGGIAHFMNAFEDGNRLHIDVSYYDGAPFDFFPMVNGEFPPSVRPELNRITFDLDSAHDSYERRVLTPGFSEMPRTDDRHQGEFCRRGYMLAGVKPDGSRGLGCVNMDSGELTVWDPGDRCSVHEPQFVPRRLDAEEGDGWILTIVNRLDENHSDLAILDARKIQAGPVALLTLPVRIRMTFHGTFVPEGRLARSIRRALP